MNRTHALLTRRSVLAGLAASAALPAAAAAAPTGLLTRPIPSTGEAVPAIGMGTWITFNVGADAALRDARAEVLRAFFAAGGMVIDSSPMYGSSEEVVGHGLKRLGGAARPFAASKIWTPLGFHGRQQFADSERLWGLPRLDLQQVHNLLNWETHLDYLKARKSAGQVRYIGVTTSHGSRHEEMARVMETQPVDFVQFTYNIADRAAELRLLPLAAERGIAVLINRPFRRGVLPETLRRHPLPGWAAELDAATWPQFLLKFVVSHPAVTCAIPATSRVDHMRENMAAARGRLPDAAMRKRMAAHVESL